MDVHWRPDTANEYIVDSATLVCLNVPVLTSFGIDYHTFNVAEKFRGVKLIPPGLHLISTSVSKEMTAPVSFFVFMKPGEVLVKEWDQRIEALRDMEESEQAKRIEFAVKKFEFDAMLGAYPIQSLYKWRSMTSCITPKLLAAIQPLKGYIFDAPAEKLKQSSDSSNVVNGSNPLELLGKGQFYFTNLDVKVLCKDSSDVTQHYFDKSVILNQILSTKYEHDPLGLVGEMQFAFVSFLIGQSVVAFEQWKLIVNLYCTSANINHPSLSYVEALIVTLEEIPFDFFIDPISADNFLHRSLKSLFENMEFKELKLISQLKGILLKKFGWSMTENDLVYNDKKGKFESLDDEAPVIVDDCSDFVF